MADDKVRPSKRVGTRRNASPLWNRALERYREELDESDDYEAIIGSGSLDELIKYAKTIETHVPERTALNSLNRLPPILKFVDDFSAVIAICFGADAKLTAFVWGSIRLIITLASSAGDTLQNALDMLEELSLTLPRFRQYEETLPMDSSFERALLDVYTEVICFYARSIHFFRSHPHTLLRRTAWGDFHGDFERTVRRLKHMSSDVESEADLAKMRVENEKYSEVLQLLKGLKAGQSNDDAVVHCYHIPASMSPRFWGRDEALSIVKAALDPGETVDSLKSFAVYGMGGVGKTQLALHYANSSKKEYDAVLWISADNTLSIEQSFRDVAQALGLVHADEEVKDALSATLRVKHWLAEAGRRWLIIFDNADDLEVLRHVWPANAYGSVLLTTRDFNGAHSPANAGLHLQPFDDKMGSDVLLRLLGLDKEASSSQTDAEEINNALGGLPLALDQIAGFITQRRIRLHDFLPLYERNAAKIDSKKTGLSEYDHTLSTVWEISLARLSGPASRLQKLLAFFDPDAIHEVVLLEGSLLLEDRELKFLEDEMDLGDAEEVLLKAALISKNLDDSVLSVHRLVQAVVMRRLSNEELTRYFDAAVCILNWGFPDTWSKDVGHQIQAWTRCEKCLPHANQLVTIASKYEVRSDKPGQFGELLLRCSWYLYEREQYDLARRFATTALGTFPDKNSLAFASATDLLGLIDLDMNNPTSALDPFNTALAIRQAKLGPTDPFIAFSLNNLAIAYTEIPGLEKADELHQQAIAIRLQNNSDRIGNSYSNLAVLLLRMGKSDEAEATLMKCPSLKNCTDETFLNTGNPRFVGDMVLLSRIRRAQGRIQDALRLASKALSWRQQVHGNRFKTCDSLYDVASLLHHQQRSASATELLMQLVAISETLPGAEGQLARAFYKLSVICDDTQRPGESNKYKEQALEVRARIRPAEKDIPFEEQMFASLNPFMLW